MIDLICKRHPAPGWVVLSELANSTGGNVRGFADAFALGIWPSHGYEAHLYEFKVSREDIKKELKDPSKGDVVGKFADYRWLVVSDLKLIETLVIPAGWGILSPKGSEGNAVLKVHRPAPKQEAAAWTRGFMAAIVRHVHDSYVPKSEFDRVREDTCAAMKKIAEREVSFEHANVKRAHEELLKAVNDFREKSGVDVMSMRWSLGNIAGAVKLIVDAQRDPKFGAEFLRMAEAHERIAKVAREVAETLSTRQGEASDGEASRG